MAGELVTAGAAFGPFGAVLGGVAEVGIAAAGSQAAPAGPSMNEAFHDFDGSGWNVNFGSGSITSSDERRTGAAAGTQNEEWMMLAMVLVGGIIVLKMIKKW